jgi:hypothetical protein
LGIWFIHVYYKKTSKPPLGKIGYFILLALIHFYTFTESTESLYFYHFHCCALVVYILTVVLLVYYFIAKRILDMILPTNIVLYLLFRDSPSTRILLLLFNYQYFCNLLPMMELLRIRITDHMTASRKVFF